MRLAKSAERVDIDTAHTDISSCNMLHISKDTYAGLHKVNVIAIQV